MSIFDKIQEKTEKDLLNYPDRFSFYNGLRVHEIRNLLAERRLLQSTITDKDAEVLRLRSLLEEVKEDGERLFAGILPVYSQKGKPGFRGVAPKFCDFCGARPTVEHNPECVITLHHALMEKLKGVIG